MPSPIKADLSLLLSPSQQHSPVSSKYYTGLFTFPGSPLGALKRDPLTAAYLKVSDGQCFHTSNVERASRHVLFLQQTLKPFSPLGTGPKKQ